MGWEYAIYAVIAVVAAIALRPKVEQPKINPETDIDIPSAELGTEIYVLFGEREIKSPLVAWHGHIRVVPIKKKGGKK